MATAKRKDNKGRILKTGEYQRTDLTYEYKYKDLNKKRKSVYAPTLKELREKEKAIQKDLDDGIDVDGGNITLVEQLKKYYQTKVFRPNSSQTKEYYIKYIQGYSISQMKIKNLKESVCRLFVIEFNKKYSSNTTSHLAGDLKACLKLAVKENAIRNNPFDFTVTKLIKKSPPRKIITKEELDRFIEFLKGTKGAFYIPHIVFLKETGLRVSEFAGLSTEVIDFEKKCIKIDCQLQSMGGEYRLAPPKTSRSAATIPLTQKAFEALSVLLSYNEAKDYFEIKYNNEIRHLFVLKKRAKAPMGSGNIKSAFQFYVEMYNEKHPDDFIYFSPHQLRHLAATTYIQDGVPITFVKELLRHQNIQTTINTYTHIGVQDLIDYFDKHYSSIQD